MPKFQHFWTLSSCQELKIPTFFSWVMSCTFFQKKKPPQKNTAKNIYCKKPWPKKQQTTTAARKLIIRNQGTKLIAFGLSKTDFLFLDTILACGRRSSDSIWHSPRSQNMLRTWVFRPFFWGHYLLSEFLAEMPTIFRHEHLTIAFQGAISDACTSHPGEEFVQFD